jgi:hypothetical protein
MDLDNLYVTKKSKSSILRTYVISKLLHDKYKDRPEMLQLLNEFFFSRGSKEPDIFDNPDEFKQKTLSRYRGPPSGPPSNIPQTPSGNGPPSNIPSQSGDDPTQQQSGDDPTQQQSGDDPTQQQSGDDPTQQQSGDGPPSNIPNAPSGLNPDSLLSDPTQQQSGDGPPSNIPNAPSGLNPDSLLSGKNAPSKQHKKCIKLIDDVYNKSV